MYFVTAYVQAKSSSRLWQRLDLEIWATGVFFGLFKEIALVQKTFCHQCIVHFLSGNSHPAVIMEIHLAGDCLED